MTLALLLLTGLVACDDADPSRDPSRAPDDTESLGPVPSPVPPWERDELVSPGSITFSELLYASPDPDLEWVELYNPMALDMDLSGWALSDAVDYTFPEGTILPARGYLVVAADPARIGDGTAALGPYDGRLDDAGERLTLRNNGGRRIDSVAYGTDDPWPVKAAGTGLTLAKADPEAASDRAENWTASTQPDGTPGAANGLDPDAPPTTLTLVPEDALWRYDLSDATPAADWADASYDDEDWSEGQAVFFAGNATPADTTATVYVTADNYYGLYLGSADGSDLRLAGLDPDGDWTTVDTFDVELGAEDHLYLAAWEAPWDYGGPQMTIAEVELPDGTFGTSAADVEWILGPEGACPGTTPADPPPDEAALADVVTAANDAGDWTFPGAEADRSSSPWGWALSGAFTTAAYVWADTFSDTSVTNTSNTYVLFRSAAPLLGSPGTTELPSVPRAARFRTDFTFDADPAATSLSVACTVDDGVVLSLNGVEVLRSNLPEGAITDDTLAVSEVDAASVYGTLSASALRRGTNVLAADVRQADPDDRDLTFACTLTARVTQAVASPTVVLNEVPEAGTEPFTVELRNLSAAAQDRTGLVLASPAGEHVLTGGTVEPDGLLVVDDLPWSVDSGELLLLWSSDRSTLLDAVRVGPRARARDADGAWRTPSQGTWGEANRIDRVADVVINEVMYHRAPVSEEGQAVMDRPEEWIELTNVGPSPVDLGGWQFVDAVAYTFPAGTVLEPGGFLVVANDAEALAAAHPGIAVIGDFAGRLDNGSDRILLLDALGNPADEVRYHDGGRWPDAADGGGSSLELRDPRADNAAPEAWTASDEGARAAWVDVSYRAEAAPSVVGPDGVWNELVLGLLDAGEVLIDDVAVIEDPDGAARDILRNGTFEDADHWRLLGNHRASAVTLDPDDPSNHVLRLVATGPTGHMHNHAETTLSAAIGDRTYEVRYRARWVSGSNQLNARLYFNRMPRTVRIPQPEVSGTPGAPNSAAAENEGPTFDRLSQDVAVPAPYTPVTVAVGVADPDGVTSALLWTSVDGGPWTSGEMTSDGTRWSGMLQGQPAGAIVQFYVEATDTRGASATLPAAGPDSRALVTFDGGEAATNGLHNLRILLTDADSEWLHADTNLMSDDFVRCTVVYDEARVFHDVGVRAKGSQRGRPEDLRLGYGLKFHPDQPFRGVHTRALIDRSEGVSTGQREVLMNLVMTHAGSESGEYNDLLEAITPLPQHRGPAELQLDRFTDLVLDAQFEEGADGRLYEYELIYYPYTTDDGTPEGLKLPQPDNVVGTPITDLGADPEAWRWIFLIQNNERADDFAPIMELGRAFASADFTTEAARVIDVDQWLRAFAFATVAGAVDNYGGDGSQHNARFYQRPSDGRMLYVPHDLDYYGASYAPVVGNADLARLLTVPANVRTYYGHLADILDRAYNPDYLAPWCAQLRMLTGQDFDSHCAFVAARADWLLYGASDAVMNRFPATDFAILTGGGNDFAVSGTEVTLEGSGWVDVRTITSAGLPLTVEWVDRATWRTTVPLSPGPNALTLAALDLHGVEVGSDTIVVTAE